MKARMTTTTTEKNNTSLLQNEKALLRRLNLKHCSTTVSYKYSPYEK